ncbi:MAG: Bifunctional protein HldE [Planctomycetes bacterium ADurb.Bin126]|nr:MAG: Bifunctional protein HldE [Planctomycetes bacterium ADurb.Bin126]HOD82197.1 PfkB family carbohydrate kinase [Phycisphaerae bacterium]
MNMQADELERCLSQAARARVAVFGDFCVDAYWLIDEGPPELSIETGLPVHRVRGQRYSLGGAGNVTANLADLGAAHVRAVTLVGRDLFGWQMRRLLEQRQIDTSGVLDAQDDWQTLVYSKPCIGPAEQNRIDFGAFNEPSEAAMDLLAGRLDEAAAASDTVILNQQVPAGLSTPAMIERINAVIARRAACRFIVDSRHRSRLYRGAILKLTAHEAAGMLDQAAPLEEEIPVERAMELASRLGGRTGREVFVTLGPEGMVVADEGGSAHLGGVRVPPPVDPVGAGDTVVSALAAVLGGGGDARSAGRLANLAASVTVKKLQTTGTATPAEIRAAASS